MFRSLTVENFRCFRKLELPALDRVNLIAGMNNIGKTSLLEAVQIHCHPTTCKTPLTLIQERGIAEPLKSYEEICRWLFRNQDVSTPLRFTTTEAAEFQRRTTIELVDPIRAQEREFSAVEIALRERFRPDVWNVDLPRLVLFYEDTAGEKVFSVGVAGFGFASIHPKITWNPVCRWLGSQRDKSPRDVELFSELEGANKQDELLPSLRILDPRIQRLSLLVLAGEPVIHANIGLSRLLPIPLMGEGVNRLLSILLALAGAENGYVLIDEIENGLHYSVMQKIWQAIGDAAERANAQVFATTHSYECIQYANSAFKSRPAYDLRLIRLDRIGGDIKAVTFDPEQIETAVDLNVEVR